MSWSAFCQFWVLLEAQISSSSECQLSALLDLTWMMQGISYLKWMYLFLLSLLSLTSLIEMLAFGGVFSLILFLITVSMFVSKACLIDQLVLALTHLWQSNIVFGLILVIEVLLISLGSSKFFIIFASLLILFCISISLYYKVSKEKYLTVGLTQLWLCETCENSIGLIWALLFIDIRLSVSFVSTFWAIFAMNYNQMNEKQIMNSLFTFC